MFLVDFYGFDHSNIPILGQITNFVSSNMYLFLYLLSVWNDHGRIICGILLFFKFTLVSLCTALSNTCVSCRDLGNSNLSGNLVPELGHLEHLQYLWVWQNIIALSFFFLFCIINLCKKLIFKMKTSLPILHLHSYKFSYIVLNCYRELYKNNIQGTIPAELGNLKSLISLDLYNNNITGNIPRELGMMKSLVFLWALIL